jgi:hypothetical protein
LTTAANLVNVQPRSLAAPHAAANSGVGIQALS